MKEIELWKEVKGFPKYLVSNKGDIESLYRNIILRQENTKDGYRRVVLMKDGVRNRKMVHRVVWEVFKGDIPKGKVINHKDENKANNNLNNLELCDIQYNLEYSSARHYIVTHPNGVEEKIFNLSRFCNEHKLHIGAMSEMATKRKRADGRSLRKHHKGFLCRYEKGAPEKGVLRNKC